MAAQRTGIGNVIPFHRAAIVKTEATLGRIDQAFALAERELARIAQMGAADGVDPRLMETMAAYVTLCGGLRRGRIRAAVRAEQAALGLSGAGHPAAVARMLREALPSAPGAGPILPHPVGAAATLLALSRHHEDGGRGTVLRAFGRAQEQVAASVVRAAQDFAGAEHPEPRQWLDTLVDHAAADVDQLILIAHQMPQRSLVLADFEIALYGTIIAMLRENAEEADEDHVASLGDALNNLAICLGHNDRAREAVAPAREAADTFRGLVADDPVYRGDLARCLNTLALSLDAVGRGRAALAAAQEAVDLYRAAAAEEPDAWQPGLAMALNTLGSMLGGAGQLQAALAAVHEELAIERELAKRPDAGLGGLAKCLVNLSIHLGALGLHAAELAPAREAVRLLRALAAEEPKAYLPDLALALSNLAVSMDKVGRRQEGLAPAREAVKLFRVLAAAAPDAYLPELGRCLSNLVTSLAELGRHRVVLGPARQGVAIRRELAAKAPDVHFPRLARALNDLAFVLSAVGKRQEAHEVVEEAVRTLATQVPAAPAAFAPWMITLEQNYRVRCREIATEPDMRLLAPMLEVLRRMQEGSGEEAPADDGLDP
jgi:tetratricopeptide (TPR) repeat protein